MDLLAVGTLAFDSVQTPFGERRDILGGSAAYLATAASYFCPVRMVGVVGADFPSEHLDGFRARGIDIAGVTALPGKTFRWRGRYDENLNVAHTLETQLNVLADFRPDLPETYRGSEFVVLGNIDPDLQIRVLDQMEHPRLVTCDTMNYWIEAPQYRAKLERALARVDVLCINDGEARLLSGEYNLVKAAPKIRALGPKRLIVKRGEHGAILFSENGIFAAPAFPLETVRDPTGAGDSFAGGLMGFLARTGRVEPNALKQAVVMGSVLASFAVEDFSLDRFQTLTPDDIRFRFHAYRALTAFESQGVELWA